MAGIWNYKFQYDFTGSGAGGIRDAYLEYDDLGPAKVRIGHFEEPFSLQNMVSSKHVNFLERGLPDVFETGRNLGIAVISGSDHWSASGGLFGSGIDNDSDGDEGFGLSGRLTWAPINDGGRIVHVGGSLSYRDTGDEERVRFSQRPESHTTDIRLLNTGNIDADEFVEIKTGAGTVPDLIEALPEGVTGELIGGQLHTQPRPSGPHALAGSNLGMELGPPYGRGRGGPGGWWIIDEPELHFVRDAEVLVPDLAGWHRERMPSLPQDQRFEVVPDWVCEILSPATASRDREVKMPVYARYGVAYAWLVDPGPKTLEAYALRDGDWVLQAGYTAEDMVSAAPFEEARFRVEALWM